MQIVDNEKGFFVTRSNPLEIYSYKISDDNKIRISSIIDLGKSRK